MERDRLLDTYTHLSAHVSRHRKRLKISRRMYVRIDVRMYAGGGARMRQHEPRT